ncbi:4-hydroxy-tetrahydrodipicolinate reductase [Neomegalonema sp.]|uniref:4-hydroxy-tetrahydrodipicolinate reductase n=1 Tax=Neomegalonema sp. TaxID=2039713 RepID=UPI00261518F2|nr:4-hydroxy-tetrahydrodipicolinate reductase [Neomegalonema sp.]MDD2867641.1 4-hydroxy-tetrahydrodipicolinate reductase [Neomegalonema sp.]
MSSPIRIAVLGASGRMGRVLAAQVLGTEGAELSGLTERPGHPWIGQDGGEVLGFGRKLGILVTDDPLPVFANSHAALDFTAPAATLEHADLAAQARLVHVIGTTGFVPEQLPRLEAAARHAVLIRAGNMSLGVNLLTLLTKRVAQALDADFDVEILETHHNRKVDAPSGTALMLGEAAAAGRGVNLAEVSDRGRDGEPGARRRGDIGFASLRAGDVVGEHEVIFAAPGERIVLKHVATDRSLFARGAVKAAFWGQTQKPGEYDMLDVLGLKEG